MQSVLQVKINTKTLQIKTQILLPTRTSELSPQLQIAVDFGDEQNGMNGHGI